METRLANIAIIVEKEESVERLNQILHKYGSYIIGRMGISQLMHRKMRSAVFPENSEC